MAGMALNLSQADVKAYLVAAEKAARAGGEVIKAAWAKPRDTVVNKSGLADLVTETDQEAERVIMQILRDAFPSFSFIGEEQCSEMGRIPDLGPEPTWLIDPLDGTTNFVHKYPWVCVSIGLAIARQVVVGVVYCPPLNEFYTATLGGGAFLNGERIRCSQTAELSKALLGTEVGVKRDAESVAAIFGRMAALTSNMRGVRCAGSAAMNLCSVAAGRQDAFFEIGFGGPWDVAAGSLMVSEAGGEVVDPTLRPFNMMCRRVLATNGRITGAVAEKLATVRDSPLEPPPPPLPNN